MRTNRSFRITYFDAATSKDVGCVEHINLTGETIYTDEWAGINMPESVAKLQDSTEFIWDAEHIPDPKADLGNILKLLRAEVEVVLQRAGITSPPSQESRLTELRHRLRPERVWQHPVADLKEALGGEKEYDRVFGKHGLIELFSCVHTTVRLIENTASLCAIDEGSLKQNLDEVRKYFKRSVKR